jgi:diketogulonate reductase-like aldo/keto reductase
VSTVLVGATGSIGPRIVAASGAGIRPLPDPAEQTEQALSAALAAGYRDLDTARPTATRKPWRGASQQRRTRSS